MMIRILFLALAIGLFGCGSPDAKQADASQDAAATEVPENDLPMTGAGYAIAVVDAEPASPRKEMTGDIDGTEVTVNYGSPSVKGRAIWGGLEAYGEVWRAGANEATTVTFAEDVLVEGEPLAAGTYSFYVIPRESGDWTVIFSNLSEQWGAYEYDEGEDALRVDATPQMVDTNQEALEYYVEGDNLIMRWERALLPISVSAAMQ